MIKQLDFERRDWKYKFSYGGELRKKRAGRGARPLSSKDPLHLVLKANREVVRGGLRSHQRFLLINQVLKQYSKRFFIKVEQVSVQGDHIHLLIRTSRRSNYQSFFRVLSGQIAQRFENEGLMTFPNSNKSSDPKCVTDTPRATGLRAQAKIATTRKLSPVTDTLSKGKALAINEHFGNGKGNDIGHGNRFGFVNEKSSGNGNRTENMSAVTPPKLWKYRPFSRVVKGFKAYTTVRAYITLNELEVLGRIPYQVRRLAGHSSSKWYLHLTS